MPPKRNTRKRKATTGSPQPEENLDIPDVSSSTPHPLAAAGLLPPPPPLPPPSSPPPALPPPAALPLQTVTSDAADDNASVLAGHGTTGEKKRARRTPVSWTPLMTEVLIGEVLNQIRVGKRLDNGFKAEVWKEVCREVKARGLGCHACGRMDAVKA